VAGFFLARWLFLHAEDKPEREAADEMAWSFLPVFRTRRRPMAALLVKELRLQQGTLVIAGALLLLHLAAVAAPAYLPRAVASKYSWLESIWMVWFVAPLLVGCASVAEERRGRTLESTLCLPVAGTRQFAVKLLVVLGLGIFLGAVMPWVLELLRPVAGLNAPPIVEIGLPNLVLVAVILTSIGCYGSSLCSTLLQAFGAALLFGVALLCGITLLGVYAKIFQPVLIIVSLYLSYANFKQSRITWRQLIRNGNIWLAAIFATVFLWYVFGGIFYWIIRPNLPYYPR
jgi:hypothetical protein